MQNPNKEISNIFISIPHMTQQISDKGLPM